MSQPIDLFSPAVRRDPYPTYTDLPGVALDEWIAGERAGPRDSHPLGLVALRRARASDA